MPSKYGFESDKDRERLTQIREAKRLKDNKAKEITKRKAQEKKFALLLETKNDIDKIICDILCDFTIASPSYFTDSKSLSAKKPIPSDPVLWPIGFEVEKIWGLESFPDYRNLVQLDSQNKPYPPNLPYPQNVLALRRESALDFVGSGNICEDVFHTWIIANSLAVMLIWKNNVDKPGLILISRIVTIPKAALDELLKTIEKETKIDCTQIIGHEK